MEYPPPAEIRSPSPTSSVGSTHPDDQTSLSDLELMEFQFEQKWETRIGLGQPAQHETEATRDPLLPRPPPGSEEERLSYERILQNLRQRVQQLHENVIFEQTLLQGSKAALETPVYARDIDAIMRSMMGPSSSSSSVSVPAFPNATSTPFTQQTQPSTYHSSAADGDTTNGPWNNPEVTRGGYGGGMHLDAFARVPNAYGQGYGGNSADTMFMVPQPQISPGQGRRNRGRTTGRR
ncbi:hypothetical protein GYMLUDRAFT_187177 [Collybiopsis luxurians FD-317 M1]|nr:hypothetical protein GYMLUDRAFT_187177 [Collybiopsis luxurians FD-317 M1]